MRLIDADALKPKVEAMVTHKVNENDYEFGGNQALDYVADILIEDAPTIDAVEVVRCKDCKYWHSNTEFCDVWSLANIAQRTLADDYCSRGERKGGDLE